MLTEELLDTNPQDYLIFYRRRNVWILLHIIKYTNFTTPLATNIIYS